MSVIFPLQVHFDAQCLIQNFPEEGTIPRGGVDLLFGLIFRKKLHENEKSWTERGTRVPRLPRSATDVRSD